MTNVIRLTNGDLKVGYRGMVMYCDNAGENCNHDICDKCIPHAHHTLCGYTLVCRKIEDWPEEYKEIEEEAQEEE